jgi:hypothetical protein
MVTAMVFDKDSWDSGAHSSVTETGIDHVRLSYLYLNEGDIDGYLSLLDWKISLHLPGAREIMGREQVASFRARAGRFPGEHVIQHVIGNGDLVVAEGRFVPPGTGSGVDFTEVFRLSDDGLLRSQKRYYFIEPT